MDKKTRIFRRLIAALLIAALCGVLFCGCSGNTESIGDLPMKISFAPQKASDTQQVTSFTAQLFFQSEDERNLEMELRTITHLRSRGRVYAAVEALCSGPATQGMHGVIPSGLQLTDVQVTNGICIAYFKGELQPNEVRTFLVMRAAIAATAAAADSSIACVNVLINGLQPGYGGRPLGLLEPIEMSLEAYVTNVVQEYAAGYIFQQDDDPGVFEAHDAMLCFAAPEVNYLLGDTRTIYYSREDSLESIARALVEELIKGPVRNDDYKPVIPADMWLENVMLTPLSYEPVPEQVQSASSDAASPPNTGSRTGQDIATLFLNTETADYDAAFVCGALTLTLMSYVPVIHGVRIIVNGEAVTLGIEGERDYFEYTDFQHLLGQNVQLAYPLSNGSGLIEIDYCISQQEVGEPIMYMYALLDQNGGRGTGFEGFGPDDVLDIYIADNIAVVNWRAGFLEKLRAYIGQGANADMRERLFVFSFVNTLTQLPDVTAVWMLEDGREIRQTACNIYLGGALRCNPGLVVE